MTYKSIYKTKNGLSDIILNSDGEYLTGLWFEGSKDSIKHDENAKEKDLEIFKETRKWLDIYFSGKVPEFTPKYKINNITDFRKEVIDIMNLIPFGETITYNDIAEKIAKKRGIKKMSAQAVGGAVGSNPICIIIPCHRVVGKNGKLTGYGGGIKNKEILLYLFFGGLTFLVSIISYAFLNIQIGWNALIANIGSWILAVSFAYVTNRVWVFDSNAETTADFIKEITSFIGGRVATLVIEELILFIFITNLGMNSMLVKIVAQVIVIVLNYVISKLIVFKK